MADKLTKSGLYFDELNKIRVLEPEISVKTNELKEECKDFDQNITQFQTIVDGFISMVNTLAEQVEQEKMKAIGVYNVAMSVAKQRDAQKQQYQALIMEKSTELERLRVQHQSLLRTEAEQQDVIDHLLLHR
ncbi:intraflagellar transport protein 20 homolog [Nilaparvata lugens]|uniref:intraflagellar transport protein 20 homolog n=1 Tax=Nilaparvata lugens TaxID=108931 RepID=UPI000B98C4C0|nr:intraflagellar transport protein 20 homolog [Nilaparvata lugens]XP_022200182.1 intraflagellar transport protein 20 homolog [Nilaparvata lugens]